MKKVIRNIGLVVTTVITITACTKNEDSPGLEYMPDMYRSPAVEAYVDYGEIRNEDRPELRPLLSALTPPNGTIPHHSNHEKARVNMPLPWKAPFESDKTHGLYGWEMYQSSEEQNMALDSVVKFYQNPVEATDASFASGKELYKTMCSHCHGDKGDGKGILNTSGKIPGIPSLIDPPNCKGSDGLMFYYITYGKGNMGAHGMLLTREERWNIVHHLRKFQDKNYPNVEPVEANDSTASAEPEIVEEPMPGDEH